MEQIRIEAIADTKKAQENVDNLSEEVKETNKEGQSLTETLDNLTGGAITGFKKMVSGVKRGIGAMKTLKGAIIATGIGALVVAVGTLYTWFTKNQQGADKLNQIFATVGATIDVLIDRIGTFGSGLWEILNGNFSAGLDILKGSFAGVGDEILRESQSALELEKAFQRLEKRKIDFIVTQAKLNQQIKEEQLLSESGETMEIRAAALQKAIDLTKQLSDERIAVAREELRIKAEQNALGESTNDDIREEKQLEAELFNIVAQRDSMLKEMAARQRSMLQAKKEEVGLERGGGMEKMEKMDPLGFVKIEAKDDPDVKLNEQVNDLKAKQNEAFRLEQEAADKAAAEAKEELDKLKVQANIATIATGLAVVQGLFEQGTNGAKFAAAAQATFDTYAAIAGQLSSTARTPAGAVPGFAIAQAIATGAFGLLQVKKILSTNTKRPSTPTISTGGGTGGVSIPRQGEQDNRAPNFESLNFGVGGQQGAGFGSIRAVVINSQFKNQQKVDARVQDLLTNG